MAYNRMMISWSEYAVCLAELLQLLHPLLFTVLDLLLIFLPLLRLSLLLPLQLLQQRFSPHLFLTYLVQKFLLLKLVTSEHSLLLALSLNFMLVDSTLHLHLILLPLFQLFLAL